MFWSRLKKLWQIILDKLLISALMKGAAAGMEHLPVLRRLGCEYIVDVGANRGQFALAARKVFPKAKIEAFEPLEEPAKIFKKVFDRDPGVTLFPFAVGRERMSSVIHVTKDDDFLQCCPSQSCNLTCSPAWPRRNTQGDGLSPFANNRSQLHTVGLTSEN